jgi:hypothetical protein
MFSPNCYQIDIIKSMDSRVMRRPVRIFDTIQNMIRDMLGYIGKRRL